MAVMWRCVIFISLINAALMRTIPEQDYDTAAQEELKKALNVKHNYNKAKNVILFIGDGMGLSTVTAARIYKGQKAGNPGEETVLAWENFPHVGLSKVYNHDYQVPDSGAATTSMVCGKKTNTGTVGVSYKAKRGDCDTEAPNKIDSIARWSIQEGKSVGVVTTTRVTHATPAAVYAHSVERDWEADNRQRAQQKRKCPDIAKQLVEQNSDIKVILGGGRKSFLPINTRDPEYPRRNGDRTDRRNLIKEWEEKHKAAGNKYKYVWNQTEFNKVDSRDIDYLFGCFEHSHMAYEGRRKNDRAGEPSIKEMTQKAIQILSKNPKGFFLFVEGGNIDVAHHENLGQMALIESLAFEAAVQAGMNLTKEEDTLIVVTTDHSNPFVIGGYPSRGNNILGTVDQRGIDMEPTLDNMPYLTLAYTNGPSAPRYRPRKDMSNKNIRELEDLSFAQNSFVPLAKATHSGQDVSVYARGPMSHLFHSTHEQNYIAHVMAYASCVGANKKHCSTTYPSQKPCRLWDRIGK